MDSSNSTDDRVERLLKVASEIIHEGGDFELPMRELAARAKVSLRTPYEIFGSKGAIIRELLRRDVLKWRAHLRSLPRAPLLDRFFRSLEEGIAFYGQNPAFYRALFRASAAYSDDMASDQGRANPERFHDFCRSAIKAGILRPEISPDVLGESLMDVFAANVRSWALGGYDLSHAEARIGYGYAMLLAAAATPDHEQALRTRAEAYQAQLTDFDPPVRDVLAGFEG